MKCLFGISFHHHELLPPFSGRLPIPTLGPAPPASRDERIALINITTLPGLYFTTNPSNVQWIKILRALTMNAVH